MADMGAGFVDLVARGSSAFNQAWIVIWIYGRRPGAAAGEQLDYLRLAKRCVSQVVVALRPSTDMLSLVA